MADTKKMWALGRKEGAHILNFLDEIANVLFMNNPARPDIDKDFQPTVKADNNRNLLDFLIQFHAAITCRNNLRFYKNPLPMFCQILKRNGEN